MLGNQSFINAAQKILLGPGRGDIGLAAVHWQFDEI